jgi:hypothetical protein
MGWVRDISNLQRFALVLTLMNELRSAGYLHVALVGLEAEKAP